MRRKFFVNLALEDIDRSVAFFAGLGFSLDPRFTDMSQAPDGEPAAGAGSAA